MPVQSVDRLQPWSVARVRLADNTTVIVKWSRTADTERAEPARLRAERSALQFLADVEPPLTPKLLASGEDLLVIEDLGPRPSLRELILAGDDRAVVDFARALGRLHAVTAGRAEEYYAGPGAWADPDADLKASLDGLRSGIDRLTDFGTTISSAAAHELADAITEILHPGRFLALTNGDVGLNNYLVGTAGDGRLIDFETAGFRHVLAEMTDLYTPGPMWITLSEPTLVEAAYRAQLATAIPEVTDDRTYGRAVAGGTFIWAARRLAKLPEIDARPAGDASRVHRVATLEAAATTAEPCVSG
ncbi:phosphotransferase [Mycolicibacterium brumae]|uniref:phosphotransferase n=1 Tax=Mycolicibacterium brumae TaxID=85968 RepID=UPI000FFAEA14|nr:phosphotransferase [Mycolicibacterium brumae]MCV7194318.1 phosphotransferase [Mycolicibacterium brumae]RWA15539.1 hypothetical protein MBRU_10840 [Mycolicibacterium brumae DSM 44177]UWW10645.1 aminoglycoside phosphotransferase family protein [Mycolicibacterium brumae]